MNSKLYKAMLVYGKMYEWSKQDVNEEEIRNEYNLSKDEFKILFEYIHSANKTKYLSELIQKEYSQMAPEAIFHDAMELMENDNLDFTMIRLIPSEVWLNYIGMIKPEQANVILNVTGLTCEEMLEYVNDTSKSRKS